MIALRKIKKYPTHSDESFSYTCVVAFHDKEIAQVHNDGSGKETRINAYPGKEMEELLNAAQEFVSRNHGREGHTLVSYIDSLAHKIIEGRDRKKKLQKIYRLAKHNLIIVNKKQFKEYREGKTDLLVYRSVSLSKPQKYFHEEQKADLLKKLHLKADEEVLNEGWGTVK